MRVATGYGIRTDIWHTHWIIETFAPHATPAMKAARQQRGELGFTAINRLHVPVAWGSMLLLLGVLALAARRREFAGVGELAAVVALAILANAAVCGALSNPNDRYGARMVWLATLVVLLVPWMRRQRTTSATREPARRQTAGCSARTSRRESFDPHRDDFIRAAMISVTQSANTAVCARFSPIVAGCVALKVTRADQLHPVHQFAAIAN